MVNLRAVGATSPFIDQQGGIGKGVQYITQGASLEMPGTYQALVPAGSPSDCVGTRFHPYRSGGRVRT